MLALWQQASSSVLQGALRSLPAAPVASSLAKSSIHAGRRAASSAAAEVAPAFEHCRALVERHDHENYLWVAQLPQDVRAPLLALRALNVETALIGDQVKSGAAPVVQMRYQWWSDAINGIYKGSVLEHPIVKALAYVNDIRPLSRYRLQKLVSARQADALDDRPPATLSELEDYAEATSSQLMYLSLEAAGIQNQVADHVASHIGKAVGIVTLLRGTIPNLERCRVYLPADLCSQHGVSEEALRRGEAGEGVNDVAWKVAGQAKAHLDHGREIAGKLPAGVSSVFLSSVAADAYLTALEKANFDVLRPELVKGGFTPLYLRLAQKYHLMRGTF